MDKSSFAYHIRQGSWYEESVKTPNFLALKASGGRLPMHDYQWRREDWSTPPTYFDEGNQYLTEYLVGGRHSFNDTIVSGSARDGRAVDGVNALLNRLSVKLNANIRATDIDLGVAFGERRETVQLFEHTIQRVVRMWQSARKRDFSGALRGFTGLSNTKISDVPKVASDLWLEFTFGVAPVLSDLHKASEILAKSTKPYVDVGSTSARDQVVLNASSFQNTSVVGGDHWSISGTLVGRSHVTYKVTNPWLNALDKTGLTNPLLIAWQLQPLSFVVDWFLPVGQLLSNVVPPLGISIVDGYTTVKSLGSCVRSVRTHIDDPTKGPTVLTFTGSSREVYKSRKALYNLDMPFAGYSSPDFTSGKVASSLALLWQKLR